MAQSSGSSAGALGSPCFILFIVFLVLKLCNVIAWSWWWVTAPLWAIPAVIAATLIVAGVVWLVAAILCGIIGLFVKKKRC